jgi:hypothetical protein
MDLNGNSFGYDYFKPNEYYNLRPEDLNPALKFNYRQDVHNYYSEPTMNRIRTGSHNYRYDNHRNCACGKRHGSNDSHTNLYLLVILLIIITVIQWFIIFFSNSSGSVTINNITSHTEPPNTEEKKEATSA